MIDQTAVPDAILVPEKLKRGRTLIERIHSVLDIAEPILGVDRAGGERAYVRRQGDGGLFITRSPADTMFWPLESPLRGRPRYCWIPGGDGIRRGYLVPEAREAIDHAR